MSDHPKTSDPAALKHAAEFWEGRYNEQHRTLHRLEDRLAELREAAREVVEVAPAGSVRYAKALARLRAALEAKATGG